MSRNYKKQFTSKEFIKLTEDMKYITAVARKWGFKKVEAEEAGFHLGDALDDMRKLIEGVDNRDLSTDELYEIMSHMPYHIELAHQSLNHDVSAGVYDFIEKNPDVFKKFINEIEKKQKISLKENKQPSNK